MGNLHCVSYMAACPYIEWFQTHLSLDDCLEKTEFEAIFQAALP